MDTVERAEAAIHSRDTAMESRRISERVVWLLGAGFSKPLGGPLFGELFSPESERFVNAWVRWRLSSLAAEDVPLTLAREVFDNGTEEGIWQDAETCLAMLDEARSDKVTHLALTESLGGFDRDGAGSTYKQLSQFLAVAAFLFVDKVREMADLPEAWDPYISWWKRLNSNDAIISFNYDRVVEEIGRRSPKQVTLLKLHGSVPDDLVDRIEKNLAISEIGMPGPSKTSARHLHFEPVWKEGAELLRQANRVVVIGYSFPRTDSSVRSFVLENLFRGNDVIKNVDIVVGTDAAGPEIEAMFRRMFPGIPVGNTGLLAQQYLVEGTADPRCDRFDHG